jgi:hypothetical protein
MMNLKATLQITALAASVLASAFLGAAQPQMVESAKFTLPYAVNWSGVTLPAGDYTFTMERDAFAATVRSANGETHIIPQIPTVSDPQPGRGFIFVTTTGGQHVVRYMNLPNLSRTLVYKPLTKSEQREIARGNQTQAEPIALAEK